MKTRNATCKDTPKSKTLRYFNNENKLKLKNGANKINKRLKSLDTLSRYRFVTQVVSMISLKGTLIKISEQCLWNSDFDRQVLLNFIIGNDTIIAVFVYFIYFE